MGVVAGVVQFIRALFASRATLAAENLALRHQLGILLRSVQRPRLRQCDRIFCVLSATAPPRNTSAAGWGKAAGVVVRRDCSSAPAAVHRRHRHQDAHLRRDLDHASMPQKTPLSAAQSGRSVPLW